MIGQLSLDQITRVVEHSPRLTALTNDLSALRSMIQEGHASAGSGINLRTAARPNIRLIHKYIRNQTDSKIFCQYPR